MTHRFDRNHTVTLNELCPDLVNPNIDSTQAQ